MRIIYNEDLNKRIIPYVDKLIKNKKKLDKETAVLFDVFIQYLDMDTRYGTYGEQLSLVSPKSSERKVSGMSPIFLTEN